MIGIKVWPLEDDSIEMEDANMRTQYFYGEQHYMGIGKRIMLWVCHFDLYAEYDNTGLYKVITDSEKRWTIITRKMFFRLTITIDSL